jgi:hypothetical protein
MAAEGFFGRWSQRKLAERNARPREEPPAGKSQGPLDARPAAAAMLPAAPAAPRVAGGDAGSQRGEQPPAPAPTLQDVAALHKESDFAPFVTRAVQPEVRNAAMKKLFSDPHFNLMDGLDTYIDDYAKPDPLPAAMLRRMAGAQFLNLFNDEKDKAAAHVRGDVGDVPREDADGAAPVRVAQLPPKPDENPGTPRHSDTDPTAPHDDDTDLRLQPDDAAGPARAGRGAR